MAHTRAGSSVAINGDPPFPISMYISGYQQQASRSKTISRGNTALSSDADAFFFGGIFLLGRLFFGVSKKFVGRFLSVLWWFRNNIFRCTDRPPGRK